MSSVAKELEYITEKVTELRSRYPKYHIIIHNISNTEVSITIEPRNLDIREELRILFDDKQFSFKLEY